MSFRKSALKTKVCAIAILLAPGLAIAQTTPAAAPAAPPAAEAPLSSHTPLEKVMADPTGRAAVLKQYPDIETNPLYEQLKGQSLRQLAAMAPTIFTDEALGQIDADLRAPK